jgi:UDP-GlcNAc:undecaprenyl-phosphate GlcNAc-1-phosphate transferase
MLAPVVALLVALVVTLVVTPLVRRAAVDADLLDEPGGRKIHVRAVPRLGGAAMLGAFAVAVAAGVVAASSAGVDLGALGDSALVPALVGIAIIGGVGLLDDLRDLSPLVKLVGQLVAAGAVVALGLSFTEVGTPWGGISLGLLGPVITVGWLVAVANAVNLIDGLDGLAAGVSLACLAAFAAMAAMLDVPPVLLLTAAGAGAVLGFLVFNRPPATIIMGDAGSMFLGMLLGVAAVALVVARPDHIAIPTAVLVIGVPLADMTWAILRRLASGKSVFTADSNHIHHQLMASGLGRGQVTLLLVAASAVLGLVGFLLAR